jgi:molybdate transport system substrate-binding protein
VKRAAALLGCSAALAGCGGDDNRDQLTISAASSLRAPLTAYAERFDAAQARLSFAGSDALAAQIRQGVKPDVFASANTKLPDALFHEGLVERPVVFAGNRLVIAVPSGSSDIDSIDDLERPGIKLAIGSESVPIGEYTRKVIGRLGDARAKAILANVRSNEPDVNGVVGKLTQSALDAGFVYMTDVEAAAPTLRAIQLPDELQPSVRYAVATVRGAKNPKAARAFIDGLLSGEGARLLRDAGFEAP